MDYSNEQTLQELEQLQREIDILKVSQQAISLLGVDLASAEHLAMCLSGAADPATALAEIGNMWMKRERALRREYAEKKRTGIPLVTKEEFSEMGYRERLDLYKNHPDLYKQLVGR